MILSLFGSPTKKTFALPARIHAMNDYMHLQQSRRKISRQSAFAREQRSVISVIHQWW